MAIPSHKDFYQVNWEITIKNSLSSQVVQSLVIAILIFAILASISLFFLDIFHITNIAYYLLVWGLCLVGVVGTWAGWLLVTRRFSATQRYKYRLSANGLEIDSHNLSLKNINASGLLERVNGKDYQPSIDEQVYSLNLPLKKGHKLIYFPNKDTHDRVIKAFNRYLIEA